MAFITRILFGRRFNYAEHLVLNSYVTAEATILAVPITVVVDLWPEQQVLFSVISLLLYVYYMYVYTAVLTQKVWVGIFKSFVALAIFFFLFLVTGMLLSFFALQLGWVKV